MMCPIWWLCLNQPKFAFTQNSGIHNMFININCCGFNALCPSTIDQLMCLLVPHFNEEHDFL